MDKTLYIERMKELRPFVSWNVDLRKELSPSEKRRITTYYNRLIELRNRPHVVYRPRSEAGLKAARDHAGNKGKVLPGFKAIPIPASSPSATRLSLRAGKIVVRSKNANRVFIPFDDPIELAKNPKQYVESLIARHPQKWFELSVGLSTSLGVFERSFIADETAKIMMSYNTAKDWLTGLYAINLTKQGTIGDYVADKQEARKTSSKASAKRKRQARKKKATKGKRNVNPKTDNNR
jgi:hypothetical protein